MIARFWAWTVAVAALGVFFLLRVAPQLQVETDLLAMLPAVERDPVVERSVRALADVGGRGLQFLVGAPDLARARRAARAFAGVLRSDRAFARVQLEVELDAAALDALYGPHRAALLSDRQRALLSQPGGTDALVNEALQALYTPAGWVRAQPFAQDPLNLHGDFLAQLIPAGGRLHYEQGLLAVDDASGSFVWLAAQIADSAFSATQQEGITAAIAQATSAARTAEPQADVIASGVVLHAAANSARAYREISTFGTASLAGVVLLVLLTFRGPRPLLLTLACLGTSGMAALTACFLLFDRVHVVTLVFGSTLVGVATDYSIHWFADQFRFRGDWPARETLSHIGPAVFIGMLATALGYQALLLPPFPGLRQMAVFSIAGVAAACACVLCWYPVLANRRAAAHRPAMLAVARALVAAPLARLPARTVAAVALALAAAAGAGLARLHVVDDIRALPATLPELQAQEQHLQALLGNAPDTRFFLVRGAAAQQILEREERLRDALAPLVARGALAGFQSVSRAVPSAARQRADRALLATTVYAPGGALERLLTQAGFAPSHIAAQRAASRREPATPLTVQAWLDSPVSAGARALWLGDASAVTLGGVKDVGALRALSLPGVQFVDRVADISAFLARYRRIAAACLAGAFAVIGMVLFLRYGVRAGAWLLLAPVGATLLTLGTLGLLGAAVNLFNVLALLLVLGMGVDYAVFMQEGGTARATVVMAILLAGLMTLLSFGLLAFSATPFIRSLGLTVLLGVSFTFVLALYGSARAAAIGGNSPGALPGAPVV